MLDLRVIRQDPEKISENCRNRNLPDLVAPLLEQDELARSLKGELDALRQRRNEISNQMKSKLSTDERRNLIEESKSLKQK
ncbi:MAG: serine--tRNA ligase, partial [SAR324 cluster bacterium]|nr:serine--tRNA ligase [SAR324 cluster bacterium]